MSQFEIIETPLAGCFEIKPKIHKDNRGRFVKLFHSMDFSELKLVDRFEEQYYAVSNQGVLRGMHFQLPPFPQIKLVTCVSGALLDVVVDLR
ncbi:MAG TPA: dTDP-4-dehydrorhamnose 3,5-epimerase family protein, partial [Anaerolineaceae bacterium]|nr:dTDP-4-dehydrorhamnose 3,5-epimerase family protein [Anaerolineaceae bacterium]